jgi:hypothetical protein
MIDTALLLLRNELHAYLSIRDASVNIIVDNIGLFETQHGDALTDNIVITLVNIEEESTLKNQPALRRPFINDAVYENPPVYLNLYVLFTCNYSGSDYYLALRRLSYIIRFLQANNTFSVSQSLNSAELDDGSDPDMAQLRFTMELYTLTFEQINHLWGSLGGRQIPFAMYKLRLVSIAEHAIAREVPLIEEVETNLKNMTEN